MKKLKLKNFLLLTIAGAINAFGVVMFLSPVSLYDSAISGTSMLLGQVTPLSLSVFLLILNVPLFLYGLKKQGAEFTVYAIYTVAMYSLFAWIITDILPVDVTTASPFAGNELILCAIFGGIISGAGSGLAIRFGGAMDGVEVLAVIFAKRIGITVGTFVMVYNVILYIAAGIVTNSWILPLYSIVSYAAALKTIDYMVEGFDRSKSAMIITSKPNEVGKALSDTFESGMTLMKAKGFYSNAETTCIYFIVNRFQVGKMKRIVHEIDPRAYISITEVANVFSSNADK
ncbi:MAG: YitT family protein [Clostridia bacterium]|nr:YitT family protein [Clostridia bacterium]MBR5278636.1 YitT family protein [Clostridia bacterium]